MENDIRVTACGWISNQPQVRSGPTSDFLTFRLGSTPRYRNNQGDYTDMRTEWFDVKVKSRALINNVRQSVKQGDPVIVCGRLSSHMWEAKDGTKHWAMQIQADSVGHDLRWGDTRFTKVAMAAHRRGQVDSADQSPQTNQSEGSSQTATQLVDAEASVGQVSQADIDQAANDWSAGEVEPDFEALPEDQMEQANEAMAVPA
ncbi:MAG: single-stranded DNA-binding protein [Micrococcales bacterium]|nr:single-stranded DNA-binding protein [Micrococcales bacterium]